MNFFRKALYIFTGFNFLLAVFADDDFFPFFFILLIFSLILFFVNQTRKKNDVPAGKEDGASVRLERLIALMIKKGVVTQDELIREGVLSKLEIHQEHVTAPMQAHEHDTVIKTETPESFWGTDGKEDMFQDAPKPLSQQAPETPPVIATANIQEEIVEKESTEFKFSANWLIWAGVIAVLLGVGFFLKYAIENNIRGFGPTGRVVIGLITGMVFLGIGEYLHGTYEKYANMLSGTGIGILYLSLYGTLYYTIGDPLLTLFFMGIVTATSLMLSVRYGSKGIAVLGLVGGYGTPLFFGGIAQGMGGLVLLNYLAILNIGVLTLAYFKNWSWAVWWSFAGTALLMSGWLVSPLYDHTKIAIAFIYLSIYWLLFTLAVLVFYYFHDRMPKRSDAILLVLVGLQYAGTIYGLMYDVFGGNEKFFGLIPLVLAFMYAGIAYIGLSLRSSERSLALYPLGMAVLFLTLIFPFELDGKWLTVGWFSESVILGFIALYIRSFTLAKYAVPVYSLGILLLFIDMPRIGRDALPILNERFFLYLVAIASAFCLMYAFIKLKKHASQDTEEVRAVEANREGGDYSNGMFVFANILIGIVVLFEMGTFWDFISDHTFYPIMNARFLLLLVVLIYVFGVMFLSLGKRSDTEGQFEGRVKTAFVIANMLVFLGLSTEFADYSRLYHEYHPILNARTLILGLGVAYTGVMSYILYRGVPSLFAPVKSVSKGMFVILNILLVMWSMIEIGGYYQHLDLYPKTYTAIFNIRTLILVMGVAYTGVMAYIFAQKSKDDQDFALWPTMFFVATNILLVVWALFEYANYYQYIAILGYTAIFNVRFLVLLLAVVYSAVVSYVLYHKTRNEHTEFAGAGYFITANVLLIFLGIVEILDYHNKVLITKGMDWNTIEITGQHASMYITGLLVLYGFVALVVGLFTRFVLLRHISIAVLVIAITKVGLNDIWNLEGLSRIVALMSLGITLLVVVYLYNRYKDRLVGSMTSTNNQDHA